MPASYSTMARVTDGLISLSNSTHLAPVANSISAKPVMLPPGRAMLETNPAPTGSLTCANTMGTVRVSRCKAATTKVGAANMTSGSIATSSAAYVRARSGLLPVRRYSIWMFRPSVQPWFSRPCRNASKRSRPSGSLSLRLKSTPMRRIRSACCPSPRPAMRPLRRRVA